jgi:hypothetical protein
VLGIFENVTVLAYADDLKLYMRVGSTDDCRLFQQDLNRLQGWCREEKHELNIFGLIKTPFFDFTYYELNTEKCKSISFSRGSKPVLFQYVIGNIDLESVDVINDLGVLIDSRMTFIFTQIQFFSLSVESDGNS